MKFYSKMLILLKNEKDKIETFQDFNTLMVIEE